MAAQAIIDIRALETCIMEVYLCKACDCAVIVALVALFCPGFGMNSLRTGCDIDRCAPAGVIGVYAIVTDNTVTGIDRAAVLVRQACHIRNGFYVMGDSTAAAVGSAIREEHAAIAVACGA